MREAREKDVVGQIAMTRKEKLVRWASLIRASKARMHIYSNMEGWSAQAFHSPIDDYYSRAQQRVTSAFHVAMADKAFNVQGLPEKGSVRDVMTFMGLTKANLHGFSCDCGGAISNEEMANRIEKLAA